VTNLIEVPTAVMGGFDKEFLTLPRDVLISVMKKHQRYFPVTNSQSTNLLPYFIAIRNGDDLHIDTVREGNEHVLGARFADADFFVREDVKHPLEYYRSQLSGLTFHTKLGSMLDKSDRMLKLGAELGAMLGFKDVKLIKHLARSVYLAKADLVTQMVTEMTSLQGVIGREYALRSNEDPEVAEAIGEQYQTVPHTKVGLVVALADRLDSLVGLFAAGLAPTGTKDPFGLRRAAIGVVQPLIEHDLDFDLSEAVKKSAKIQPIEVSDVVQKQILDFIKGRLFILLLEETSYEEAKTIGPFSSSSFKYIKVTSHKNKPDVVEAVITAQSNNPAGSARAVKQLQTWVTREDWSTILEGFARCVRITRDQKETFKVDEKAFAEKEEKALFTAFQKTVNNQPSTVNEFLEIIVKLIPSINAFFDKVLVMAEDKKVKENRLGLLQRISALSTGVADLSKLEGF
jgi:glycyl-tRNA synthetase